LPEDQRELDGLLAEVRAAVKGVEDLLHRLGCASRASAALPPCAALLEQLTLLRSVADTVIQRRLYPTNVGSYIDHRAFADADTALRRATAEAALRLATDGGRTPAAAFAGAAVETVRKHLLAAVMEPLRDLEQRIRRKIAAAPLVPPDSSDSQEPVILSLGDGAYQLEGGKPIKVGDAADNVLQAYLGSRTTPAAEVLTTPELVKRSGQDYPGTILRTLRKGPLGPAICCPGRNAKGQGYAVCIRWQPPP
jgi:hypothetical protein